MKCVENWWKAAPKSKFVSSVAKFSKTFSLQNLTIFLKHQIHNIIELSINWCPLGAHFDCRLLFLCIVHCYPQSHENKALSSQTQHELPLRGIKTICFHFWVT
jgi:hypothetical protein